MGIVLEIADTESVSNVIKEIPNTFSDWWKENRNPKSSAVEIDWFVPESEQDQ
jgi:hypothetical protein